MIGTVIENYRITEQLGAGGMGEVYKAVDIELEREVAVKCMRRELSGRDELAARFRAEARMLAKLHHPNVATVYRFFEREDQLFLVMEYVDGEDFGDIMRGKGLAVDEAVPLFGQALAGIGYAHQQGVVHRDLKPSNLMIGERGLVKVLDFGIAHLVGSARMTKTGMAVGTPAYMAPEQVRGHDVDPRTDLYSLGIVFYEMLTGKLPFEAQSDFEAMRAHLEEQPRDITTFKPDVPQPVQDAIYRALAKDTSERFATAEEFAQALGHPTGTAPAVSAAAAATVVRKRPASAEWGDRIRGALEELTPVHYAAATAGLLAVILAAILLWPRGEADPAGPPVAPPTVAQTQPPVPGPPTAVAGPTAGGGASQPPGTAIGAATGTAAGTATVGTAAAGATQTPDASQQTAAAAPPQTTGSPPTGSPPAGSQTAIAPPTPSATVEKPAPPPKTAAAPRPSVRAKIVKIDVHRSMRLGRLNRPAGYNMAVDLRTSKPVRIDEVLEARENGRLVMKTTVSSTERGNGRYQSKHRVADLKSQLVPGEYDMKLRVMAGGRELASHRYKLLVR
ncbi:MAG: protein kinase [Myxococcota bacterium]|nr:protein kinase [Myxococcota bacterium]